MTATATDRDGLLASARKLGPLIREHAEAERHFRDAQTLRHPGFLSESRVEAVGQVLYCGLPPEFAMVAF